MPLYFHIISIFIFLFIFKNKKYEKRNNISFTRTKKCFLSAEWIKLTHTQTKKEKYFL